jgi:hypothetical protein
VLPDSNTLRLAIGKFTNVTTSSSRSRTVVVVVIVIDGGRGTDAPQTAVAISLSPDELAAAYKVLQYSNSVTI